MRIVFVLAFALLFHKSSVAQTPPVYTSLDILQQLKKMQVLGSVLYVAAHPDDENNTLLPYLAKEKHYRTAYLSLTRGDGGQNLIGDEQGIDLGLIRTQELIAARNVDGAEQYFSRAYEFGYSKSATEALRVWDKEKILADMVWVIRQYQPDIIIKRFPGDNKAGHGHHSASALLADEAFIAAGDAKRFPEQLKKAVKPWQARRILWNTYNFGSNNTTSEDQLKIDIGGFNPYLGKTYGELGAEARTMHKSQGEGRPRRRGPLPEYFLVTGGEPARTELMEGINTGWSRIEGGAAIASSLEKITRDFDLSSPSTSLDALIKVYGDIEKLPNSVWKQKKLEDLSVIIQACSGLFLEVTAQNQLNVIGDSARFNISVNNRLGIPVSTVTASFMGAEFPVALASKNENSNKPASVFIPKDAEATQPYWLSRGVQGGSYEVSNQDDIGKAWNDDYNVTFAVEMNGRKFNFVRKILYKYTDPVKGELYQPIQIVHPFLITSMPPVLIFNNDAKNESRVIRYTVYPNTTLEEKMKFAVVMNKKEIPVFDSVTSFQKGIPRTFEVKVNADLVPANGSVSAGGDLSAPSLHEHQSFALRKISYDHIPDLYYNFRDEARIMKFDLKTKGKLIGYIAGAGDKVPQSLEAMGYDVRMLGEADLTDENLKRFDAIITGIRAYNVSEFLSNRNDVLMRYVQNGGNMIVQYLKSNNIGQKKVKVGPYPFSVDPSTRVTEEDAPVTFLLPTHPALNFPNKISQEDFQGWVQERSTYQAVQADSHYDFPLGISDTGEKQTNGSLAIAAYGKGNFVYASLVFFRQLPAAVPGAYRLLANLIALPQN